MRPPSRSPPGTATLASLLAILAVLGLAGPYPAYHMLSELVSVVLGLCIFFILYNARRYVPDPGLQLVGASLFFASLLDLLHILTFNGHLVPAGTDIPVQLLAAARGIQALSAMAVPALSGNRPAFRFIFFTVLSATAILTASILWWKTFPSCYVVGEGATLFMKGTQLVFAAAFLASLTLLRRMRRRYPAKVLNPLCLYLAFMAASELIPSAYGGTFALGGYLRQLLTVAGFGCAFMAFNYRALEDPLNTLFDSMRQREQELALRGSRLLAQSQAVVDLAKHPALSGGDMHQARKLIAETAVKVLGGGHAAVLMANAAGTDLVVMELHDFYGRIMGGGQAIPVKDHPELFEALSSGRTVASGSGAGLELGRLAQEVFGREDSQAVMAAGIRRRGRMAGLICHAAGQGEPGESMDRQLFLASLADLAAMTMEINERNLDKLAREESEERLSALIQALPDQVCFKDDRGRWLVANHAWLLAHDVSQEAYRGATGGTPGGEVDRDGLPTRLRVETDNAAWSGGRMEFCVLDKWEGSDRAHHVLKMAVGPSRQPRGLMVLSRDVTGHRQAVLEALASGAALEARTREVQALNETLEARVRAATHENRRKDALLVEQSRLAAMGEMIGIIAHQWRQPLNSLSLLVANLSLDARDGALDAQAASRYQKQCRDILNAMSRNIDEFRAFFRPDREPQAFNLAGPAREAIALAAASMAQHGVSVEEDLEDAPEVFGFRREMAQVILNLLVNARDAIDRAGRGRGRIVVGSRAVDGQALLEVSDDGGGVPEEAAQWIFDPFFSTKARDKATGLGLYISRRIIEEHMGGSILFVNSGEGAVFTLSLPATGPATGPASGPFAAAREQNP